MTAMMYSTNRRGPITQRHSRSPFQRAALAALLLMHACTAPQPRPTDV
jgi:hypothetical protein